MTTWETYLSRLHKRGTTTREVALIREKEFIEKKLRDSLSYHETVINGVSQNVAIVDGNTFNEKTIFSMPDEKLIPGSLVEWGGDYWLINSVDPNKTVYTRGTLLRCNYKLKWINDRHNIVQRWCVVDDGTAYTAGETNPSTSGNRVSLGDTRVLVIVSRDSETIKINRSYRFIIDDYDTEKPLAYRVTNPLKVGGVYNGDGVLSFLMSEVNTEDDDNLELHIADYYKHFPRDEQQDVGEPDDDIDQDGKDDADSGKKVWL